VVLDQAEGDAGAWGALGSPLHRKCAFSRATTLVGLGIKAGEEAHCEPRYGTTKGNTDWQNMGTMTSHFNLRYVYLIRRNSRWSVALIEGCRTVELGSKRAM
jgi:hypothetical protein